MLKASGTTGVFTLIAAAMAVVVIVIWTMGPKTTQHRLEELAR
jgi:hypothetical protein